MMERRIRNEIINFKLMKILTIFLEMMVQKSKLEESPLFAGIMGVSITWRNFFLRIGIMKGSNISPSKKCLMMARWIKIAFWLCPFKKNEKVNPLLKGVILLQILIKNGF